MHSAAFRSCPVPIASQSLQKPQQQFFCQSPRPFAANRGTFLRPKRSGSCNCLSGFSVPRPVWLSTSPGQASTAATHSRTVCSAADSTAAAISPSSDESRKASNAAASTSDSQSANSSDSPKTPASPYQQLFLSLESMLLTVLAKIASFFKGFPAFVQREKLQRLHKRALDNPIDADRLVSNHQGCTSMKQKHSVACCPTVCVLLNMPVPYVQVACLPCRAE